MVGPGCVLLALLACAGRDSTAGKDEPGDTGATDTAGADSDSAGESDADSSSDTGETDTWSGFVVDLADTAIVKLVGDEASFMPFPVPVSAAGDVDGDGHNDVILGRGVSGLGGTEYGGAAYVFRGPIEDRPAWSDADARLIGADGECAGESVAGAGDVNADGFDDVIVGAPCGHPDADYAEFATGQSHIVLGPVAGDVDLATSDATLIGEYEHWEWEYGFWGSGIGNSVAGAGDVNGDGFADVLTGGGSYHFRRGIAYLVSGPITGEIDLATQSTMRLVGSGAGRLGSGVASAGDTNGDGLPDIVIGQYGEPDECVLVFTGPASGDLVSTDADGVMTDSLGADAGKFPRSAGDVDGDGYSDLVIDGAAFDGVGENSGAAFVFTGPLLGVVDTEDAHARLEGPSDGDVFWSVDGPGDVNGDGFDDVLVGASGGYPYGPGTTYVQFGPMSGVSPLADASVIINGEGDDQSGDTVAGAGDIDGDGLADILIGGGGDEEGGTNAGAAWLVFGSQMR